MRRARTLSMLKRSYRPKFLQCDREAGSAEAGAIRHIGPWRPRGAWLAAPLLLAAMGLLLLGSAQEDALTFDEPPHITAGYVSHRFQEAWLNPEHPPLLKLLAALPLLPLPLHFPRRPHAPPEDAADGWGPQWQLAHRFLYTSGNDPARIAARARLAPIGVTLGLGFALWRWGRRWAGGGAALLALWLYSCSPTILAHGRYVTTDLAAAFGVVLAGYSFARFLAAPSCGAALLSALTLGLALLCKFSTVLLVPWFAVLTLLWSVLHPRRCARYLAGLGVVGSGAALLVLLPYLWMTAQYPPAQQLRDTYVAFATGAHASQEFTSLVQDRTRDLRACAQRRRPRGRCPADLAIFLADKPVLRAWGHYLFGLAKVLPQVRAGHARPTYFLGEVSQARRWAYFPVLYAVKETLPFHLLTALALGLALGRVGASAWGLRPFTGWLRRHPADTLMLGWLLLYWGVALRAHLYLGVRHLLPVFPFTILLVAREITPWLTGARAPAGRGRRPRPVKPVAVALLLLWQGLSIARAYPAFLAYFNEVGGGPGGGARYAVDSNLDWGQDLRRLRAFADAHRLEPLALDYFGTASPRHELGARYLPWRSALGPYPGWLAVSATTFQTAQGQWDATVPFKPAEAYAWLRGHTPVAAIGGSILVFDLRDLQGPGAPAAPARPGE